MKKRSIALIMGLMGFALLGVVAMQYFFLRQSFKQQSELFDRDVNDVLTTVRTKMERQDANRFVKSRVDSVSVNKTTVTTSSSTAEKLFGPTAEAAREKQQHDRRISLLRDSLQRLLVRSRLDDELYGQPQEDMVNVRMRVVEVTDENGYVYQRQLPPEITAIKKSRKLHKYDTAYYQYSDPQLGRQIVAVPQINPLWQREQNRKAKERRIAQIRQLLKDDSIGQSKHPEVTVMESLAAEYKKVGQPLKERIDRLWLDSLLRYEFANKGISMLFDYEVTTANNDSLIYTNAHDQSGKAPVFNTDDTYRSPIFTDVVNDPGQLKIRFPDKNAHIINTMTYMLSISGGLLLVLIFCFGFTLFSILRQKKISEMKTDFINNMTHEFKTPVSTIMIASEALKDKEIMEDKARVGRLADIIYEENARLGSHIERVLNIARIEKNDFKLDKQPIEVNELIMDVLSSMSLRLQKSNAHVEMHLDAEDAVIEADELHFSNVIFNLVDNAIKYSRDEPQLTITTLNKGNQLVIRVADKGIGMSRDQQAKIFEQFYRVPTGNLHDVKGFGLGLSYVNTIVKRLEGMISVRSEKEKGSEFELKFNVAA
ncbi:HAMP domain-containing histidine kinase [Mucilaginibacter daejeonensis]|uniref:sensor histidine kinase n=1 Tax=Mucilaginibacter daejeonensis TaxID=398049 RepID=UPI001D17010F|nr:HAMP domain-containing sensor histidine kinase [Mucilaginibacter daejeonensis]UEG53201.1 HAMP domain-containing histidine kinase [Mucilaginibacter daejeonensis]